MNIANPPIKGPYITGKLAKQLFSFPFAKHTAYIIVKGTVGVNIGGEQTHLEALYRQDEPHHTESQHGDDVANKNDYVNHRTASWHFESVTDCKRCQQHNDDDKVDEPADLQPCLSSNLSYVERFVVCEYRKYHET